MNVIRSSLMASLTVCGALAATAAPAMATTFTASDVTAAQGILSNFNAVVTGTYTKGNETEGLIVAGGNLVTNNNGNVCFNGCSGSATVNGTTFGAATIYGSVSGSATFNVMNGNAAINGSLTTNSEFNHAGGLNLGGSNTGTISDATFVRTASASAGTTQNVPSGNITTKAANAFAYGTYASLFSTPLNDLTAELSAIVSTLGNVQAIPDNTSNYTTTAKAATGGKWSSSYSYGFYTATNKVLADDTISGIFANGLNAVFIVDTDSGSLTLPTVQNGDNTRIVWVLPNVTSISLKGQFQGTILAPNAAFDNGGGNMSGLIYANTVNQSNEFHKDYEFTGNLAGLAAYASDGSASSSTSVPEPGSLLVLSGGLLGLAGLRRRHA